MNNEKPVTELFEAFGKVWVFILFIQLLEIAIYGEYRASEPNSLILAMEILGGSQLLIALISENITE